MAYDFFPKNGVDLAEGIKNFGSVEQAEIQMLFHYLKEKTGMESPINIDKKHPRKVNVSRAIDGSLTTQQIKRDAKLDKVKIKFGNGSSGNRGVNNRGNLFEPQFAEALLKWWDGDTTGVDVNMLNAIEDMDKTYDLKKSSKFRVDVVGGENTRRPLKFSPSIELTNTKGTGYDVGKTVTDITLHTDKEQIYLSLKLGTTTTFFNVGVRTILTPTQIKNYDITNKDGQKLLNLFGIDPNTFCDVFNQTFDGRNFKQRVTKYNQNALKKLLESGVGYGYHIIHKMRGKILSKKMDKRAMQIAAKPQSLIVYYGGKTGTGRRVDMELETPSYTMKLNIRDTQGGDGYPTRMMCDFTTK